MRMKIPVLILLVLAGGTFGAADKRIVGSLSRKCTLIEGLHQVILSDRDRSPPDRNFKVAKMEYESHCGGSLIHERWVLTAEHCNRDMNGVVIQNLVVIVGHHPSLKGQVRTLSRRFPRADADIMLLELASAAPGLPTVPLPELGNCATPALGTTGKVVGLMNARRLYNGQPMDFYVAQRLRCGEMDVVQCNVGAGHFCAFRENIDGNKGDSGNSFTVNDVIYGVQVNGPTVFTTDSTIFMDVCHYRQWIRNTANV